MKFSLTQHMYYGQFLWLSILIWIYTILFGIYFEDNSCCKIYLYVY